MKRITYFIIALTLSIQASQAQERTGTANEDRSTSNQETQQEQPGEVIHVSHELYQDIISWLGNEEKISIADYLMGHHENSKAARSFLNEYSGKKKLNKNTNPEECNCKTVIPTGDFTRSSAINKPWSELTSNELWGPDKKLFKERSKWIEQRTEGLGMYHAMKAAGWDWRFEHALTSSGDNIYQLIYLCSDALGMRSDLCNCDKDLFFQGDFFHEYKFNNGSWHFMGNFWSHGVSMTTENTYIIYTAERDVQTGNLLNYDLIDSLTATTHKKIDDSKSLTAIGNTVMEVANLVNSVSGGRIDSIISNLGSVITSLDNIRTQSNNGAIPPTGGQSNPFVGIVKLHANIPRIFHAASSVSTAQAGYGSRWNTNVSYQSFFYWAFKMSSESVGYSQNGNQSFPSSACCNESFAAWDKNGIFPHSNPTTLNSQMTELNEFLNIDFINGDFNWQFTNKESDIILPDGKIQVNIDNSRKGFAVSLEKCGCDEMLTIDDYGNTVLMKPTLTLSSSELCDGIVTISVDNLSQFLSSNPNGQVQLKEQSGSIISSIPPSPATINSEGRYSVSFSPNETSNCITTTSFSIDSCTSSGTNLADCLNASTSIYPMPISSSTEFLNFETCIRNCVDSLSVPDYIPTTIEIRKGVNNPQLIYSSNNIFSPLSATLLNGCVTDNIDLRNLNQFPFQSGTVLLVTFKFSSNVQFTRPVVIQ